MSDWARGDLALCIRGGEWRRRGTGTIHNDGPMTGDVLVVVDFTSIGHLCFAEFPARGGALRMGYNPCRFRKIRPSAIKHIEALKDIPVPVRETENA